MQLSDLNQLTVWWDTQKGEQEMITQWGWVHYDSSQGRSNPDLGVREGGAGTMIHVKGLLKGGDV